MVFASSAQASSCADALTQADMNACAAAAYETADKELNVFYFQIQQRLAGDTEALIRLRDAQRAWIGFRDAECAFESSGVAGGSVYPMILSSCRARLTDSRVEDFRYYLDCEEGDLSCPLPPAMK
ncbi:MAG: DUF1311 domain-containing protein [Alphaproteobacteria bacterium]|nr:DUF1311 domain-containing protein [Alphaproteobacteria bacterium]MBU0797579.1 DUF1311 domain-containing protein [Alphaproteobacteria bacterium]MBU0885643.1 DUF1311 domain-containing protein [Alphaproteobacteria bacterium]MBU1812701.1 DUF1311 domain-containing protein [Alphaproteobacteria bacterium]MBU2090100.1 DUF1311 domain-containing protein [Alphaproteobacteria bacterium]